MNKILLVILGAVALIVVVLFGAYNGLVTKNNAIDGAWAQVETQYQRRFDLIPNLVESAKGVMQQEKDVFEAIANARTQYGGAKTVDEKVGAAQNLDSALSRLLVIVENYPQLRSSETVSKLMDELAGTENRIAVERRRFNELVQDYNLSIKVVPSNLIAGLFGFRERKYFQPSTGAEVAPKVDLKTSP
ncbi:LemA family protein [Candidatus Gottesmanbacteria bacterium RIFCSPHIGHO2_02_FULL_39_11]|uniref:LemA family protein n=1 Tax=Candidatus Gottesmanbacteria bacterium RIFCSPHIGHO2_02_FULL_39_11 TaxID=1798382 RepID=A0A1F5ZJQ1_9BACT|nr:MAG: LemA family protein [Candidatus Gottesmanbacteria bacterium RIFCSPHIGHO2_02_FULL_39_11]